MKGLARVYEKSRWDEPGQVDAFLAEVDEVPKGELLKCYEFLLAAHGKLPKQQYRLHCMAFIGLARKGSHRSLFVPLTRGLKRPNPLVLQVLEHVLPMVNNPREHKELAALLGDEDPAVRDAARHMLLRVFGPKTVEPLLKVAHGRGFSGFDQLLQLVATLRDARLHPVLEAVLVRGPSAVRRQAVRSLADPAQLGLDEATARRLLLSQLESDDLELVGDVLRALSQITSEDEYLRYAMPALDQPGASPIVLGALKGLRAFRSPRVFGVLEGKLAEGPGTVRLKVLEVLEDMAHDDVLPTLVEAISHEDIKVQAEAVRVLRELTSRGAVDPVRSLMWLLRSKEVQLRRLASEVIDALPGPRKEVWPRLINFLRDEDWWVRERVLDALIQLAGQDLTPHLVALLKDPSPTVRRLAVEGLAKLANKDAVGALVRAAGEDEDWWVREAAVEAIGALQDERAVPYVVRFLKQDPEIAVACLDTLRGLKAEDATDEVVAQLASEATDVKLAALHFLATVSRPDLSSHIEPLLYSEDPELSALAREVLEAWSVQLLGGEAKADEDKPEAILDAYLQTLVTRGGDDLMFSSGQRVFMKKGGEMVALTEVPLTAENVYHLLTAILEGRQVDELSHLHDVDLSYRSPSTDLRFRVNVFQAHHGLAAVFRRISEEVPDFDRLGLPPLVKTFSGFKNGLVLVGGPPGSGKSTTLAALLKQINHTEPAHIMTVEDPIEALHPSQRSVVNQREIGSHTASFGAALRSILRQDPDVLLIGELRDLETVEFALRAAETGHLVFGTVHTFSADTTVDRLVNTFPAPRRDQARGMLADSLRAVLCQFLLPDLKTGGRVIAAEILLNNDAVANVIRKGQSHKIPTLIQMGADRGLQAMDAALAHLFRQGRIDAHQLQLRLRNKDLYEEIAGAPEQAAS